MKKTILLAVLALTMFSCGYNLKTDSELARDSYQITLAQEEVQEVKDQFEKFKDSVAIEAIKEARRKDSLEFMDLSKIMCWDKRDHRHSCEVYGNSLLTSSNENIIGDSENTFREPSEVASNE